MYLGLNAGFGASWQTIGNLGKALLDENPTLKKGNLGVTFDFGFTYDFYLFSWLSVNTGALFHPNFNLILEKDYNLLIEKGDNFINEELEEIPGYSFWPVCITIPLMVHINVPVVDFLYAGIGVNFNIPIMGGYGSDMKKELFLGIPMDLGFDLMSPGRGGMRFFFRVTPEFHKGFWNFDGMTLPIGVVWQVYNWKIH